MYIQIKAYKDEVLLCSSSDESYRHFILSSSSDRRCSEEKAKEHVDTLSKLGFDNVRP